MKVQLNWKESSYSKLPELHIAASEIVSDETFEQMQAHPLWDHDVIQKHIQDMRSVAGGEYCLLIAPENGTDGLLVRSEGSSCARYSAYIPGGRLMTLVTPELERALRKCETAAKECALPGFVDSKNEEKTERNAGYLVVSHSGGGMLRQGTRKGIRRTPANRGMRAHRIVKSLDISEDVCHGLCP